MRLPGFKNRLHENQVEVRNSSSRVDACGAHVDEEEKNLHCTFAKPYTALFPRRRSAGRSLTTRQDGTLERT